MRRKRDVYKRQTLSWLERTWMVTGSIIPHFWKLKAEMQEVNGLDVHAAHRT